MHWASVGEFFFPRGDLTRIYRLNFWTYVLTGFWEYESGQRWKTNLYKYYRSAGVFVLLFSMYSYLGEAVLVRHDLDQLSFNMSSNALLLITSFKVTLLKLLANLDNNLNVSASVRDQEIFQRRARIIINMQRFLWSLLGCSFVLRVLADTSFDRKTYLIPVPFGSHLKEYYGIIYALQVVVSLHFLVTVLVHDLIIYGIINRFIGHFQILEKNFLVLGRLFTRADAGTGTAGMETWAGQVLKENIRHHQELLKEILSFTRIYGSAFIIQASAAVFITGIVAIKIQLMSSQVTPLLVHEIMYTLLNLTNNLFLCTLGSDLTSKSVAAANALYGIPWSEMGAENRRTVSIAMRKLQAGAKLKGGGLLVINRRIYLKFLQISYNMIVLLRNLYRS